MARSILTKTPFALAIIPMIKENNDIVDKKFLPKNFDTGKEDGWENVKKIFRTDEFGQISPEFSYMSQASFMGLLTGIIYGGFLGSRKNYLEFMERNEATAFVSHLDAKKKLQDKVTLGFAKFGFRFGWRLCYFSTAYTSIVTMMSVYRGKSSVLEHTTAGALTGSAYKINLGLRGMIAGGLVGGVLGTGAGCFTLLVLKLTGSTMEDIRNRQYQWRSGRDDAIKAAVAKQTENTDRSNTSKEMAEHDARLGGTNILDLNKITALIEMEQAEIQAEEAKKLSAAATNPQQSEKKN